MPIDDGPDDPSEGIILNRPRIDAQVSRLTGGILEPMPNIVCLGISGRVGAEPWSARFRYRFDQLHPEWPNAIEHVMPIAAPSVWAASPYIVHNEDRLVVRLPLPNGFWECIFDGFAKLPQADLGNGELVTFEAIGTPERCWDYLVPGALMRDANEPTDITPEHAFWTSLPTRFNPDGLGNATQEGYDQTILGATGATAAAPVFMDEHLYDDEDYRENPSTTPVRKWTLGMAVRYLIVGGNVDQLFVKNPSLGALSFLLLSIRPKYPSLTINWTVVTSYELSLIIVPDTDVTGMSWPDAIETLIAPHGFGLFFDLMTTSSGYPEWWLRIRRNDDNTFWKVLGAQARGAALDPTLTSVRNATIQRDGLLANEVIVDTDPKRYEASFMLSPIGWDAEPSDADDADNDNWIKGSTSFNPIKFRVYGFDETGEGHWNWSASGGSIVYTPGSFANLFYPLHEEDERHYVRRRRPGFKELFSTDSEKRHYSAQLWFTVLDDYTGEWNPGDGEFELGQVPGLWDDILDTDWQEVTEGGWQLLPDRLGIIVTTENVRAWKVSGDGDKPIVPSGVLDLVRSQADPKTDEPKIPRIVFRLTCVIEGDQGLEAEALRRPVSPTLFTTQRRVDTRDRFQGKIVSRHSHLNAQGDADYSYRNDTDDAIAYAEGLRREYEALRFTGVLSVPRVTTGIRLCDKVIGLAGRDLYFGSYTQGQGEGERYPMVVGIDFTLDGDQSTRLMLSDRRSEQVR